MSSDPIVTSSPAIEAEFSRDNAQDEALGREALQQARDAQDRADARARNVAAALSGEPQFIHDVLVMMAQNKSISAADAEKRVVALLAVRRRLLSPITAKS